MFHFCLPWFVILPHSCVLGFLYFICLILSDLSSVTLDFDFSSLLSHLPSSQLPSRFCSYPLVPPLLFVQLHLYYSFVSILLMLQGMKRGMYLVVVLKELKPSCRGDGAWPWLLHLYSSHLPCKPWKFLPICGHEKNVYYFIAVNVFLLLNCCLIVYIISVLTSFYFQYKLLSLFRMLPVFHY